MTIKDGTICTLAGDINAGAICAHLLTDETSELTLNEFMDMLEPEPTRTCVPVPNMDICSDHQDGAAIKLMGRGGAMVMSAHDWGQMKTELDQACRELGKKCSKSLKKLVQKKKVEENTAL